jgi:hypothetical protein
MRYVGIAYLAVVVLGYAGTIDAAAPDHGRGSSDFSRDFGIARVSPNRDACLTVKNRDLKTGQTFTLVWVPVAGVMHSPEIRSAPIRRRLPSPCDPVNSSAEDTAYTLDAGTLDTMKIYIAVIAKPIELRVVGVQVRGKIGASRDIVFRSCSSFEGLHFTAWTGGALKGKRIWHSYYYLGYDVEPTCIEADFKE